MKGVYHLKKEVYKLQNVVLVIDKQQAISFDVGSEYSPIAG